jgi:hypothetical protein
MVGQFKGECSVSAAAVAFVTGCLSTRDIGLQIRAACSEWLHESAQESQDRRGLLRERLLLHTISKVTQCARVLHLCRCKCSSAAGTATTTTAASRWPRVRSRARSSCRSRSWAAPTPSHSIHFPNLLRTILPYMPKPTRWTTGCWGALAMNSRTGAAALAASLKVLLFLSEY